MNIIRAFPILAALGGAWIPLPAATPSSSSAPPASAVKTVHLADVRMRDACILPDRANHTYYIVASARGAAVRAYTSKDLVNWTGPYIIFRTPPHLWGDAHIQAIWAPELHEYRGKYYLFLTFSSTARLPEQWRNWLPRVRRGSQILWADSPLGPYHAFAHHATTPTDMVTLDGTFWVQDGVPYMVFSHEWVQIVDGTMNMIRLKPDLSGTIGEPVRLFFASDAPWSVQSRRYGCWITDGPYLYRSKSGRLFMIWSSESDTGYAVGLAVSDSGKLAGPWVQQSKPIYQKDGGHGMIFRTFGGQLMLVLHQPNEFPKERIHLFELQDTGDTLRIVRPYPGD